MRRYTDLSRTLWVQAMPFGKGIRTGKEVLEPRSGTVTFLDVVELQLPASFNNWNRFFFANFKNPDSHPSFTRGARFWSFEIALGLVTPIFWKQFWNLPEGAPSTSEALVGVWYVMSSPMSSLLASADLEVHERVPALLLQILSDGVSYQACKVGCLDLLWSTLLLSHQ